MVNDMNATPKPDPPPSIVLGNTVLVVLDQLAAVTRVQTKLEISLKSGETLHVRYPSVDSAVSAWKFVKTTLGFTTSNETEKVSST